MTERLIQHSISFVPYAFSEQTWGGNTIDIRHLLTSLFLRCHGVNTNKRWGLSKMISLKISPILTNSWLFPRSKKEMIWRMCQSFSWSGSLLAAFFSLWQLSDWMHVREESWTASVEKLSRRLVSHDQSFQPTFQSSQNGAKSWGHRTTNVEDFYKNLLLQEIRRSHELILSFRCLLGYVRKNLRLFRSSSPSPRVVLV